MLDKFMEIKDLLSKAQDLFDVLPRSEQAKAINFHTEHYSLAHCLRWGLQASEELIEDVNERLLQGETIKYEEHQMYYDKMSSEYVVEQFEYEDDYHGSETPMYSVVDGFDSFNEAIKCISDIPAYKMQVRLS